MMPRFFKDMPKNQSGIWVACVIRRNDFRSREVWRRDFNGLRRAYVAARLMALWEDFWTSAWFMGSNANAIAIDWAVRKPIEGK